MGTEAYSRLLGRGFESIEGIVHAETKKQQERHIEKAGQIKSIKVSSSPGLIQFFFLFASHKENV